MNQSLKTPAVCERLAKLLEPRPALRDDAMRAIEGALDAANERKQKEIIHSVGVLVEALAGILADQVPWDEVEVMMRKHLQL